VDTDNSVAGAEIARIFTGIHRLSSALSRLSDATLQQSCGFGMSQFRILWMLYKHPEGVQQNKIAHSLNLTEAAISRQMRVMKEQGLLDVVVDPQDRRSRSVQLTSVGVDFTRDGIQLLVQEQAPYFAGLPPDQRKALAETLDELFYTVSADLSISK
jgi:DNA-binding MarR family transcriptional regulator